MRARRFRSWTRNLKSQDGTFLSFSDEAISFRANQNEVAVQRPDVLRVSSREGMSRGQHALIGLAVGAAAGAIWGATLNVEEFSQAGVLFGTTAGLGGIGAGVGAALPAGRPTIYRAERRQAQTAP